MQVSHEAVRREMRFRLSVGQSGCDVMGSETCGMLARGVYMTRRGG